MTRAHTRWERSFFFFFTIRGIFETKLLCLFFWFSLPWIPLFGGRDCETLISGSITGLTLGSAVYHIVGELVSHHSSLPQDNYQDYASSLKTVPSMKGTGACGKVLKLSLVPCSFLDGHKHFETRGATGQQQESGWRKNNGNEILFPTCY